MISESIITENSPARPGINSWNPFPPRSRYEHESCVTAEEDLGQSQDCQVLHSRGKHSPSIHWLRGTRQVITWSWQLIACFHLLWQHQMDPTGNFYNYRTALRGAAHRSQTANSNRERVGLSTGSLPILWKHAGTDSILYFHFHVNISHIFLPVFSLQIVIPFFSLLIKDIYFLNEGCANRLPNGHVNFEVRQSLFFSDPASFNAPTSIYSVWFCFLEICGVGTAGWGVHDMETGGVSFWGGSGHPTLPPHCSHLQRGRWEPVFTSLHVLTQVLFTIVYSFFSHSSPGLYLASYESESPENQVEKDRWKALR